MNLIFFLHSKRLLNLFIANFREAKKMARDPLLAQIHIAKKALDMEEDDYRSFLQNTVGVTSSKGLSVAKKEKIIEAFEAKGWVNKFKKRGFRPAAKDDRARLIFGLWTELGKIGGLKDDSRRALFAFCRRMTRSVAAPNGITSPDWMNTKQLNVVIEALKAMIKRTKSKK